MTKVYVVSNPKGGVGKTTTSINFATVSATIGRKVLFIDLDPNASSTMVIGARQGIADSDFYQNNVTNLFREDSKYPSSMALPTKFGFDIILGSSDLQDAEQFLQNQHDGGQSHLIDLFDDDDGLAKYDEVYIDTGGRTGRLLYTIIMAADHVIVPSEASKMSTDQVEAIIPFVEKLAKNKRRFFNQDVSISHVLLTKFRQSTNAAKENLELISSLLSKFDIKLANAKIPVGTVVEDANIHRLPVVLFDQAGAVSKAYFEAYEEIIGA